MNKDSKEAVMSKDQHIPIYNFKDFSGGFQLTVDTGISQPICCIVLTFPNQTQVTVRGDEEIVKQIVDRLDGLVVEYEAKS